MRATLIYFLLISAFLHVVAVIFELESGCWVANGEHLLCNFSFDFDIRIDIFWFNEMTGLCVFRSVYVV